jgi:hypothetical protein
MTKHRIARHFVLWRNAIQSHLLRRDAATTKEKRRLTMEVEFTARQVSVLKPKKDWRE